ncbi:MAG: hypothetical protein ABIP49_05155, partial [Lysobacterales bacterium]
MALAAVGIAGAHAQDFPRTPGRTSSVEAAPPQTIRPDFGNVRAAVRVSLTNPADRRANAKVPRTLPEKTRSRQLDKSSSVIAGTPNMTSIGGGIPRLDERIAVARDPQAAAQLPLAMLGQIVEPNQRAELNWEVGQSFDGGTTFTPVTV